MITTMAFRTPAAAYTAEQCYDATAVWLNHVSSAHPDFAQWWLTPRTAKDKRVPFSDRKASVARIVEDDERFFREYPVARSSGSCGVVLSNVSSSRDWSRRGKVALVFHPAAGDVRLSMSRIDGLYASPTEVAWSLMSALAAHPQVSFAQTNIMQRVNDDLLLYSVNRAVFSHREFLGWMGYVDSIVTEADVPDAARLQRLRSGTLVLSTMMLDLADATSVKQANEVETSLAELGCLPVTGAGLK